MKKILLLAAMSALLLPLCVQAAPGKKKDAPSRPASKDCKWEKVEDKTLGLAAWVQRCDYGFRKIDLFAEKNALMMRYSDGGKPNPLIETFDLKPGESLEAGVKRVFAEHTPDKSVVARCLLKPYKGDNDAGPPAGAKRYTFVANAELQKEVDKKTDPGDIPEPACGEWGDAPDGIQYFEVQPTNNPHKVMFVRAGQDEPMFDEKTLRLLGDGPIATENPENY